MDTQKFLSGKNKNKQGDSHMRNDILSWSLALCT